MEQVAGTSAEPGAPAGAGVLVPAPRPPERSAVELVPDARGAAGARAERARLARELHDSVMHALFAVHQRALLVERALARDDPALLRTAAAELRPLTDQALAAVRRLVDERRTAPSDLEAALAELVSTVAVRDALPVVLVVPAALPPCPASAAEQLVGIAAEALHNAVKHAGAAAAQVELVQAGSELVLTVRDDGRGFDPRAVEAGHGQRTMRERAAQCGGWVHVDSAPGSGTRVVARVPLPG